AVDLADRFGEQQAFGLRVNAAAERLDPALRDAQGHRNLLAVAGDWRATADTLLEAEIENSHRSQPSQPGFSMLGDTLPSAKNIDPRINLNNQPWSQPVVLDATTASLRLQRRLTADWKATVHYGSQRLRSDDRLAYAYGCGSEGWTDRYCSDGSFDFYDFRSDNESRRTDALDTSINGRFATANVRHDLTAGMLRSQLKARFGLQAYNGVGTGTIDGLTIVPSDPTGYNGNANRTERNNELYARDRIDFAPQWSAWLGLRHTRLDRESAVTDGTNGTRYQQSFTTPWVALSHEFAKQQAVYVSWGEGVETTVTPNNGDYLNPGAVLPAQKSRQLEIGIKGQSDSLTWAADWFDVHQPTTSDIGIKPALITILDGDEHHRGIEGQVGTTLGALHLDASGMWLDAKREGSQDTTVDGHTPTNVPRYALKLQAAYRVAAVPGLSARAAVVREGHREVLPDDSVEIPGWTRTDLGVVYTQRVSNNTALTWNAGVTNAFDQRAWRESPYQYGHVYLYPLAPRTWTLSMRADF
ncbi:TonB-dependent siderophore receptor, partial [Aquabacterium sp.]|uniref:TonB-dependent siderophore receptor n=1 Tax=Aquabacterium sp. TaxID=1872578 RepID=UPI0035B48852